MTTTVWSSDMVHEEHKPPTNLKMKKGAWQIGEQNVTTLVDKESEEQAVRNSRKEHRLTSTYR